MASPNNPSTPKLFGAAQLANDNNAFRVSKLAPNTGIMGMTSSPGELEKAAADPFWAYAEIQDINWNKSFPFQLLILQKEADSSPQPKPAYKVYSTFTLPIPPQSLVTSMPFAISTEVTLGGIVEQHNGAPLRTISLQGTFGLMPLKGSAPTATTIGTGKAAFAATVQGADNTVSRAQSTINAARSLASSPSTSITPANVIANNDLAAITGSGFVQMQLMERFLESYAYLKKTSQGKAFRLAFARYKENTVFLVTPNSLSITQAVPNTLTKNYSLQFTAWKRISASDLIQGGSFALDGHSATLRSPNKIAQTFAVMREARRTLENTQKTLKGVVQDVQRLVLDPLRQTNLFLSDLRSTAITLADMPADLLGVFTKSVLEINNAIQTQNQSNRIAVDFSAQAQAAKAALDSLSISSGKAVSGAAEFLVKSVTRQSIQSVAKPDPAAPPYKEGFGTDSFDFLASIEIGKLALSPSIQVRVEQERLKARSLGRLDFQNFSSQAQSVLDALANACGMGSSTYNAIYRVPNTPQTREPGSDDLAAMSALGDVIQAYDSLALTATSSNSIPAVDFIAGLATRSGIAFQIPQSKVLIPLPYGMTLERLASIHLGTPDRWHEIAALNGLKAPYIDEVGMTTPLLAIGLGSILMVNKGLGLYVGQSVVVSSNTVRSDTRRIIDIREFEDHTQITLDGTANLYRFTTADEAVIQYFAPFTTNSRQSIYIPSDEVLEDTFGGLEVPGLDYFDPLTKVGGVDLLLDSNNDLVLTPQGDAVLSYGLNNIVQKARLALTTLKGSLLHHPSYGLGVNVGTSNADVDAQALLQAAQNLFSNDPSFSGVQAASVRVNGSSLRVQISVVVRGTSKAVPITVDI